MVARLAVPCRALSPYQVIEVAQLLGKQIRPPLKCAGINTVGLNHLEIPAALGGATPESLGKDSGSATA